MAHNQKISSFTNQALFQDTDLITFVRNGTNFNGLFSTLKLSLGTTGTLNPVGSALGVPTLQQPVAGTNNFRAIESGAGIVASVSAENGINLKWSVAQDSVGFPITSGLANAVPVMTSLIAGTGMNIAQGVDSLTLSATGETTATHTIIINQESDFPIQDATTITLSEKVRYVIGAPISSAKRLI